MAAAAIPVPGGSSAAVRLPRSPPVKVLAEQLRRDATGGPGAWRLSRAAAGREPLELAAVWMQGTVVEAAGGEARLRDPSGVFSVRGLDRVPRGRPCLVPGNAAARVAAPALLAAGEGRGTPGRDAPQCMRVRDPSTRTPSPGAQQPDCKQVARGPRHSDEGTEGNGLPPSQDRHWALGLPARICWDVG